MSKTGQLAKDSILNVGTKMLIFGGGDGKVANNLTSLVDTTTWTYRVVNVRGSAPAERVGHAAALIGGERKEQMVIFGGFVRKLGYMFDTHVLDIPTVEWRQMSVGGTVPDGRINHTMNALESMLYVYGGSYKATAFGDVHRLDSAEGEWTKLDTRGFSPPPRAGHSAQFIGDKLFIFGGATAGLKVPTAPFEDSAPCARLVAPTAQAAPPGPGAPPEPLGSSPWPRHPAPGRLGR